MVAKRQQKTFDAFLTDKVTQSNYLKKILDQFIRGFLQNYKLSKSFLALTLKSQIYYQSDFC